MSGTNIEAVILLADAEGFSRTCAALVAENPRGADVIGRIVQHHLASIEQIVTMYGGHIVAFSGDAICALWPIGETDRRQQLARAAEAGLRIAASDSNPRGEVALRFRTALDCGPCHALSLGDGVERVLYCGPVFDGLGPLSAAAVPGRLALSEAARAGLGDACVSAAANGVYLVENLVPPRKQEAGAILPPGAESLAADGRAVGGRADEWTDEICAASVLFLRYPTLSTGAPSSLDLVRQLDSETNSILTRFGGAFIQSVVDDKGLVVTAAWGIARSRSERDASRAIGAATALQAAARACGVAADIGISSSRVYAGFVGRGAFRVPTVLGAAMNRAAWLMLMADGRILIDQAAHDQAEGHVALTPAEQIRFKGDSTPEACFTPGAPRVVLPQSRGRMVGRTAELDTLEQAVATAPDSIIWITGEAGIGKSHFLGEAHQRIARTGIEVLTGVGDSLLRSQPLEPWRPILRGFLPEPAAAARDALSEILSDVPDGDGALPLVADLFGIGTEVDAGPETPPGEGSGRLVRLLVDILARQFRHRAVTLCFEDAHWLDTASWQLLGVLKARLPALGILLVNRPIDIWDLPQEARTLLAADISVRIELQRLDLEETRVLVGEGLGADLVPEALVRKIQERAEGHPYYTKELAAALVSRGTIVVTDRHCHIRTDKNHLDDAMFPETIEVAIAARFAELSPAAQLTLKVASVDGRNFSPDLLPALHPHAPDPDAVTADLAEGRALGLVEDSPGQDARMRFHHALTRDTIYGLMTDTQREVLHRKVAESYERAGAATNPDQHAILAYHWAAAGEAARAIGFFDSAAERAALAHSHLEQVSLLREALRLDETLPTSAGPVVRGRWLNRIARAHFHLGNVSAAVQHGEQALSALVARMPTRSTMGFRILGELFKLKTNRPGPRARDDAERARLLDAAQTCVELSFNTYELGDLPKSIHATFLAANLAERAGGASAPKAVSHANLALAGLSIPFLLNSPALHRSSIRIAQDVGDPAGLYWIGVNASTYAFATGALHDAIALADQAITVSSLKLEPRDHEAAMSHKANFVRALGRFREGLALDSATLASARDRGVNLGRMWGLNGCCRSLVAIGDVAALRVHTDELAALLRDPTNLRDASINQRIVLALSLANLSLASGDAAGALAQAGEAAQLMSTVEGPQYYLEEVPGQIGDLLLRCWLADPGLDVLTVAKVNLGNARMISKMYPVGRYRLPMARGDLAFFNSQERQARKHWRAASDIATRSKVDLAAAHAATRLAFAARQEDPTPTALSTLKEPPAGWLQIAAGPA